MLGLAISGTSHVGVVRTNNEDAFAVTNLTPNEVLDVTDRQHILAAGPRGVLVYVADGVGGERAGEVASALVLEPLRETLKAELDASPDNVDAAIEKAVQLANTVILEHAEGDLARSGMASTLVAMVLRGDTAHIAWVGDSRLYLLRGDVLSQISKDQTQAQILIDMKMLTPEEAKSSAARNILLQALGKSSELTVAQVRLALREGDRFLLCSDGLTLHVTEPEIAAVLGQTVLLDEVCAKLIAMTLERGARDNVTVVTVHVANPHLPRPSEPIEQTITTIRELKFGE